MFYDTSDIDKLISLCNELYNYTVHYDKIYGHEEIYKKFIAQLEAFEKKHCFMSNNYAPRDVLVWFIHHAYWISNDLETIRTILNQIKTDHFVVEKEPLNLLYLWNFIDERISSVSKQKFIDGHYADAVESAMKAINTRVKVICKLQRNEEKDGTKLMQYVFSSNNPVLMFEDTTTESGQNTQVGYMQLFVGAMQGLRNPKAHDNLYISQESAIKQLVFASLLMDKIDEALLFTNIREC